MDDQPTPTEDNKKPVLPNLTSEDIKLLVITFVGTVAANLMTAICIGLAIATARVVSPAHDGAVSFILLLAFSVVAINATVVPLAIFLLRARRGYSVTLNKVHYATMILSILFAGFLVLLWVGIAVGIK